MDLSTLNDNELMASLKTALDTAANANAAKQRADATVGTIEDAIRDRLRKSGKWEAGCGMKIPGLSISVQQKFNAAYDPDKWGSIVKWAAENDYAHIVQRRISAAPLRELEIAGVALPDGLRVEPYLDMSTRRS